MVQVIFSDNFYDDISKHYIVSCWSINCFVWIIWNYTRLWARVRLDHVSRVPPTCRDAADSAPACVWTQGAAAALSWAPAPANKHSYSLHIGNKTIVCSSYRPPVKEEQVPPRPRVFHCVLDKFDNSWALKSCKTSKTKISCKNNQEIKRSCDHCEATVGVNKNWRKRRSWGFQNTPNLQNSEYYKLSYGNLKKIKDYKNPDDIQVCSKYK